MNKKTIKQKLNELRTKIAEVIVDLSDPIDIMLVSLLSEGHLLIEGPPGLGKTTLANTFADTVGGTFNRIQMTPDLLPSDIVGVNVYNPYDSTWVLRRGPIFGNVILIDELNRASPKVQSAFLQAMQEKEVTIENETLQIKTPFMVVATQVPLGEQGTYPLTNVQIDRFAYKLELKNPDQSTEIEILERIDQIESVNIEPTLKNQEVQELIEDVRKVHVESSVKEYIVKLVHQLRENNYTRGGPSPRASIWILKGARAYALIQGRGFVIPDDVKTMMKYVVPHRLDITVDARAEDITTDEIIKNALNTVRVPKELE
jgi:MoxR-like ATPase